MIGLRNPLTGVMLLLTICSSIPFAACTGSVTESKVLESSFTVSQAPQLVARIANGSVTVRSGTEATDIKVVATLSNPDQVDYRTEQEGNTVELTADVKGGFQISGNDGGVDLDVTVPENVHLDLVSSNGRITIENISGSVSAETSNGVITIIDVNGAAVVRTSNGRIEVHGFNGEIEAQTSTGAIDFEGELRPGSDNSLATSNGPITVTLAGDPSVDLDARTSNGKISSDLPVTIRGSSSDNQLAGTIGAGESRLELRTSNGSIAVK